MTEIAMEAEGKVPAVQPGEKLPSLGGKCPQAGCIRPYPHEGMRHRYAETKELKKDEPKVETVAVPEPDNRPFSGPIESKPMNHVLSPIDGGLMVAWDTCDTCKLHITRCWCPNGPTEPRYIRRWRSDIYPINDPPAPVAQEVSGDGSGEALPELPESAYAEDAEPLATEDHDRAATHVCTECGEELYLVDTPDGARAFTVSADENHCAVSSIGIHFATDLGSDEDDTDDAEDFGDQPIDHGPADAVQDGTDSDGTDSIDPEVGF